MAEFYFQTNVNYQLDQSTVISVDMETHTIVIQTHTPHIYMQIVIISIYTLPVKWLSLAHNKPARHQHRLLLAWVVQYW